MTLLWRALIVAIATAAFYEQINAQAGGKTCNQSIINERHENIDAKFCECCDYNSTCSYQPDKGLSCKCKSGYTSTSGTGYTGDCIDTDECALGTDSCDDFGGVCINTDGGFKCDCKLGYKFVNGSQTTCEDIDECNSEPFPCNRAVSTCVNTEGSYRCDCKKFYEKIDGTCVDINECDNTRNTTLHNCKFKCVNEVPGFKCECGDGYTGDGNNCKDIDECSDKKNKHNCSPYAKCSNTDGSFNCTCNNGLNGNGTHCDDILECQNETLNECGFGTVCNDTPGSYKCDCLDGYRNTSNIFICADIDECDEESNECDRATTYCINNNGSYTCDCYVGLKRVDNTSCTGSEKLKKANTRLEELKRLKLFAEIHSKQLIAETLEHEKIKLQIKCKNKAALIRPKRSFGLGEDAVSNEQLQMHIHMLNHYISRQTLDNQLIKAACNSPKKP